MKTTTQKISWTVTDLIDATDGILMTGDIYHIFSGISIDSRTILPDECFLAIMGDVYDGHTFVTDVIQRGVKGVIVDREKTGLLPIRDMKEQHIICLLVDNTRLALGDLAAYNRRKTGIPVAAITGSSGKTTTRMMAAEIASKRFNVLSTSGNLNNEIGLPLTLLKLDWSHEWAVLELGMNRPGEIGRLAEICKPNIGMITNIGPVHLEGLGSVEGVMEAKAEIIEKLAPDGRMILNADDPMAMRLFNRVTGDLILFGLSEKADIRGKAVADGPRGISFQLDLPEESVRIDLGVPGKFMVSNALAAAAIGHCLKIPISEIKHALESFTPYKGRMNTLKTEQGICIIDDTYNANPISVKAALDTLQHLSGRKRCVAVLGDMLELGETSWELHQEVGKYAAVSGITKLYVTGNFADAVKQGACEGGMPEKNIFVGTKKEIFTAIKGDLKPNVWILIKGSRGMRMETLVQTIQAELEQTR